MPTVLERPQIRPETIERPEWLEPIPPQRPRRRYRWLAWFGGLLAAAAVALIVVLVINAQTDDGVAESAAVPDHLVVAVDPLTPVTPVVPTTDLEPRLGFGEDATAIPDSGTRLVEQAPGTVPDLDTGFMEEATVSPEISAVITARAQQAYADRLSGLALFYGEPVMNAAHQAYADRLAGLAEYYSPAPVTIPETPTYVPEVPLVAFSATQAYDTMAVQYQDFLTAMLLADFPVNPTYMPPQPEISATQAYESMAATYEDFLGQRYEASLTLEPVEIVHPDMMLPDPIAL